MSNSDGPSPPPSALPNAASDAAILTLDDASIRICLQDADELKRQGNESFRAGKVAEALAAYRSGLGRLPKRAPKVETAKDGGKGKGRESPAGDSAEDEEGPGSAEATDRPHTSAVEAPDAEAEPLQVECAKARAVMNANIGACHVKLGEHKEAVSACTEALVDDPTYVKALQRRAASSEKIDSWSSLTSAQEDYEALLLLLPATSSQAKEAARALREVKPRAEAAQKKEMAETMGKLKGLGNSILGNFGLSTDNFKFEPNGQGGYSMNFVR